MYVMRVRDASRGGKKKGGKSYKLFGILPLINVKRKNNGSERYKLLSIIPILTKKVK